MAIKRAFRSWSDFTSADVQRLCDHTPYEVYCKNPLSDGEYMPEYTAALNGRSFTLDFGGRIWRYEVLDTRRLCCEGEGERYEGPCSVHPAPDEPGMYFIQHYCPGSHPPAAHTLVLDLNSGHAVLVRARMDHPRSPKQVQREFLFGTVEGVEVTGEMPDFTDELVGTAVRWTYQEHGPQVKHIYCAPCYYSYVSLYEGGFFMASNPADYVKLNDHMYIVSMIEERQTGTQLLFLINRNTLRDVASYFGCYVTGMECSTAGAKGELSELYTTEEEYRQMIPAEMRHLL